MTRSRVRLFGWVLAFAAAQTSVVLVYLKVQESRQTPAQNTFRSERLSEKPGPDLELSSADGATRQLGHFRGKTVLLHFWATWCPPCRDELPGLLELGRELSSDSQFQIIAVSLDNDWPAVRAFFAGDIPPEVMRDRQGSATQAYGVSALPDTYLLASDGSMRLRFSGARDWRSAQARKVLLEEAHRTSSATSVH